ncbi:MAG: hypothetical protein R3264_01930, partial [Anaerolineae bacterium]|nr:hypothetical protein [Anaerolineae bacterium]
NAPTRWLRVGEGFECLELCPHAGLRSPSLESSFDGYQRGFRENLNDCYAGLNALSQVVILTELADQLPEVWRERFEDDEQAAWRLKALHRQRQELEMGVKLAVDSDLRRATRNRDEGGWASINEARLTHLLSNNPRRVAHLYTKALIGKTDYALESSGAQLDLFFRLGILKENTEAAMAAIERIKEANAQSEGSLERVVLFAGHRIDSEDREIPRFPPEAEQVAREMIHEALTRELAAAPGDLLGISGGASGADILFQEVCQELGIRTELFLAFPELDYCRECVQDAGLHWVERFNRLCRTTKPQILSDAGGLPRWLRDRERSGYDVFLRSSHWMIHNALSLGRTCTLIALWDGAEPDGPGGTYDIIKEIESRGVKFVHLDTRQMNYTPTAREEVTSTGTAPPEELHSRDVDENE